MKILDVGKEVVDAASQQPHSALARLARVNDGRPYDIKPALRSNPLSTRAPLSENCFLILKDSFAYSISQHPKPTHPSPTVKMADSIAMTEKDKYVASRGRELLKKAY